MCLDYRHVNKHLATDVYLLPRLEELVKQAAGPPYYITLDMREAYFQIMLDEEKSGKILVFAHTLPSHPKQAWGPVGVIVRGPPSQNSSRKQVSSGICPH